MKTILIIILLTACCNSGFSQFWRKQKEPLHKRIESNTEGEGHKLHFDIQTGSGHNNPSFAIWIEDLEGNFIQEIFVSESVATGIFRFGDSSSGKWEAGQRRYQAALPYFFHRRNPENLSTPNIPDADKPVLDAYTGATPKQNFKLISRTNNKEYSRFRVLLEVNQTWDFNNYWHNAKFPDDRNYRSSAQPSIIYAVEIDTQNPMDKYYLNPIGHGHYSGKTGNLYTDLSTFTSALEIFTRISLVVSH